MLMKSKIIVIVVAAIMIFAGFYVYTQMERNNNSPAKHLNVYPPDYHIVVNSTYNIPNSNATYSNGSYTECITHFYVGSKVNFSNIGGASISGTTNATNQCQNCVFLCFINQNKSAMNYTCNRILLCFSKGSDKGTEIVYGGHNDYKKSPRGCWGILANSNFQTKISIAVCNYAGNNTACHHYPIIYDN